MANGWQSVKGRLFLAFLAISALLGIAALAALFAVTKLVATLDEIVSDHMPANFAAMELSRGVERVVRIAPQIAADRTELQQMQTDRQIRRERVDLERLLDLVRASGTDHVVIGSIAGSIARVRTNVAELQQLVARHPLSGSNASTVDRSNVAARVDALLRSNQDVAADLTAVVDRFVEAERAKMEAMRAGAAETSEMAKLVLFGAVALGIIGSSLIVWLYVGRSIVARLAALSTAMLALAKGDLGVALPPASGNDEIARMCQALRTFRDTAVEKGRIARLRHFLSPQVAEMIISTNGEAILDSHRRDVAVVFCDLRGFTAFAEAAEPEDIMSLLRDYHAILGRLIHQYEGTLERFTGDGLMCFFNDPVPCANPCLAAVSMASEMRSGVEALVERWRYGGSPLGFGIGISYGFATLGRVGYEGRFDYAAIGSVTNLAARLCERARPGEILIDANVLSALDGRLPTQSLGRFTPRGFSRSVEVYNVAA
jgi:class 3 adenylate cyclase